MLNPLQHCAAERVKLSNVESIDYLAPNSAVYRRYVRGCPGKHA